MFRTALILAALAAAGLAIPAAAQTKDLPMPSERVGQEIPIQKKTPEQIAREEADKERIRADAVEAQKSGFKSEADRIGQETWAHKKTSDELAAEAASRAARRGTTAEEQARQYHQYGGG